MRISDWSSDVCSSDLYLAIGGYLAKTNDRYLQNIAYLRFKNLTVGYSLPVTFSKKVGIDQVRLYFSGENLAYWSPLKKNTKYADPETAYVYRNKQQIGRAHV